ncbi:DUF4813 domain-containing protein [Micromonospora andamanensis]|uniref:Integral membrane protein n=1 Tax=Micromonospora andamanensis TaxID=1287068 RepID=A0ABQ4HMY7_9ACTN|nr:DUF4813 domain-containing protein [Micromonospora andamanensis]GIJ07008.1 hypothetical protein Van01_02220 [Micromonospora andamanensis]
MDIKVWMYLVYLAVSIGLTVWVARALTRNGLVFLDEVFADERLARAVNNLLVVGFYLLNLGYVTVAMRHSGSVGSTSVAMEELSLKIGLVLLVLGALHFFNVFALGRYRRNRLRQLATHPPLAPVGRLPMQHAYPPVPHGPRTGPAPGQGNPPAVPGQGNPPAAPGQGNPPAAPTPPAR